MSQTEKQKEVVIIGGGPGGYVAAIRAAQLGGKVTLIEKKRLGGTCLNRGCIPTKALLHASEYAQSAREVAACGVHVELERVDWNGVLAFKDSIVNKLVGGVESLLRAGKVTVVEGEAAFLKPKTLEITKPDGSHEIMEADHIILATGSVPVMPPIEGLRESRYVIDSTGALTMEKLPASMLVIGGGVIGLEMACALQALGCQITIAEALPRLAPTMDGELSAQFGKVLESYGVRFLLEHKVVRITDGETSAKVTLEHNGETVEVEAESVLCAVGRRPSIDGLNAEAGGIACERGRVLVNEYQETNIPGVYAIGDCVGQIMLAHTASAQGEVAAENIFSERTAYQPACVPSGIYGFVELGGVGMTEEEVKAAGTAYHVGRFPLSGNGRALIADGGVGMVKVLIGDELGELLGVHILGPNAIELLGEAAIAISMEATVDELIHTIHAHPTVTEAIREAALAAEGRAIHMPNKAKKR